MQTPGHLSHIREAKTRRNLPEPAKSCCELNCENIYRQPIEISTAVYSLLRLTLSAKNHPKYIVKLYIQLVLIVRQLILYFKADLKKN